MLSAGKGVDLRSLHIGCVWRGGRVSLFDWLSESRALGQGRGELQGDCPGSAASGRGGPRRQGEREWGRVSQRRGGAQRKGQGAGERAGSRNDGRSGPTGRADCSRGGATPGD